MPLLATSPLLSLPGGPGLALSPALMASPVIPHSSLSCTAPTSPLRCPRSPTLTASPASSSWLCELLFISRPELSFPSYMGANECTYFDFIISKLPNLELDFLMLIKSGRWFLISSALAASSENGTVSLVLLFLLFFAKNNLI